MIMTMDLDGFRDSNKFVRMYILYPHVGMKMVLYKSKRAGHTVLQI